MKLLKLQQKFNKITESVSYLGSAEYPQEMLSCDLINPPSPYPKPNLTEQPH